MTPENYFNSNQQYDCDLTSYEEQLLLNYDNYLEAPLTGFMASHNHYAINLDSLQDEELEDDMESEYDENDWEEVENDLDDDLVEHYDENERDVDTFSEDGYKVD